MEYLTLALLFLAVFLLKALASAGVLFFFFLQRWMENLYGTLFSWNLFYFSKKNEKLRCVSVYSKDFGPKHVGYLVVINRRMFAYFTDLTTIFHCCENTYWASCSLSTVSLTVYLLRPWCERLPPYSRRPYFSQAFVFGLGSVRACAESDAEMVGQLEWLRRRRRHWDGKFIWKDLEIIP